MPGPAAARRACKGGVAPGHQGRCSQTGGIVMLGILASSAAGNAMRILCPGILLFLELRKQPWLCAGQPVLWTHRHLTLAGTAKQSSHGRG